MANFEVAAFFVYLLVVATFTLAGHRRLARARAAPGQLAPGCIRADEGHVTEALILRDLRMDFAKADGTRLQVLDGVDLEVRSGEFFSIVGPSGCGKTTLLDLVLGLASPTAGTVDVAAKRPRNGVPAAAAPALAHRPRQRALRPRVAARSSTTTHANVPWRSFGGCGSAITCTSTRIGCPRG